MELYFDNNIRFAAKYYAAKGKQPRVTSGQKVSSLLLSSANETGQVVFTPRETKLLKALRAKANRAVDATIKLGLGTIGKAQDCYCIAPNERDPEKDGWQLLRSLWVHGLDIKPEGLIVQSGLHPVCKEASAYCEKYYGLIAAALKKAGKTKAANKYQKVSDAHKQYAKRAE